MVMLVTTEKQKIDTYHNTDPKNIDYYHIQFEKYNIGHR